MKLELTIKADYLPSWGIWQGLRELMQNARDAQVELNAPMEVRWSNDTLIIENEGCTLPHEALLLGHSTKVGKTELIGKFGEGLKLGILALVRLKIPVKIRSGSEVWVPTIQQSEKFNAPVLTFDIQGGRKEENRVSVEVKGITKDVWEKAKWKFRFLSKAEPDTVIETSAGTLLLDPEMKGHVFVKGIYVETKSKLDYGYDLKTAELDRDRKMIEHWNFAFRAKDIVMEAMSKRPDLLNTFIATLERQTPDVDGFDPQYMTPPAKLAKVIAADFRTKHGENAVPVKTLAESKDLDHLGKKGIIVSTALSALLTDLPKVEEVKLALREETLKQYNWHELSDVEQDSVTAAIELIREANPDLPVTLSEIDVVDFRSNEVMGLFKQGRIQLAKRLAADRDETLASLVHEAAHALGPGDGEAQHVALIEKMWTRIVKLLRNRLAS